jgi:GT2 family glycosyltransferase
MKIAAVIVTYNRLDCLKRCVEAVRRQSQPPDQIIIINNGSTDGTKEWLAEQERLTVITQENLGGAGGFHTGFKRAFDDGCDWIWSMDDDGLPTPDCLQQLLQYPDAALTFRSPLALDIESPSNLAFELLPSGAKANLTTKIEVCAAASAGLLPGIATPFNGILIHRSIIATIGLPLAALFIWGDEVEFQHRAQKAGFKVGIITSAEFLHPKNRLNYAVFHLAGRTHSFPQRTGKSLRDYLAIRNTFYIEFRYLGFGYAFRRYCYCVLFHLLDFGPAVAWQVFCAGQAGYWGYLQGHRKYLPKTK